MSASEASARSVSFGRFRPGTDSDRDITGRVAIEKRVEWIDEVESEDAVQPALLPRLPVAQSQQPLPDLQQPRRLIVDLRIQDRRRFQPLVSQHWESLGVRRIEVEHKGGALRQSALTLTRASGPNSGAGKRRHRRPLRPARARRVRCKERDWAKQRPASNATTAGLIRSLRRCHCVNTSNSSGHSPMNRAIRCSAFRTGPRRRASPPANRPAWPSWSNLSATNPHLPAVRSRAARRRGRSRKDDPEFCGRHGRQPRQQGFGVEAQ